MSFQNKLFQNEFIPVVAQDQTFRSRTKSGRMFHNYHVWAHSGTELRHVDWLDRWLILLIRRCFYHTFIPEWKLLCKREMNCVCDIGMKLIPTLCKHHLRDLEKQKYIRRCEYTDTERNIVSARTFWGGREWLLKHTSIISTMLSSRMTSYGINFKRKSGHSRKRYQNELWHLILREVLNNSMFF